MRPLLFLCALLAITVTDSFACDLCADFDPYDLEHFEPRAVAIACGVELLPTEPPAFDEIEVDELEHTDQARAVLERHARPHTLEYVWAVQLDDRPSDIIG